MSAPFAWALVCGIGVLSGAMAEARLGAPARVLGNQSRCFGAASRDPERPCRNKALRLTVTPTPQQALITPSAPCIPLRSRLPGLCTFGTRRGRSSATIALLGDSHAVHWRAALDIVARAKRWHAISLYRSRCPFLAADRTLPEPERSQCRHWNQQVVQWFRTHPRVHTVFTSANSGFRAVAPPGQGSFDATVAAYAAAWNSLPASVKHIVVIRDVPHQTTRTAPCILRAMAARRRPGAACALPRAVALHPDAAATAAAAMRSPRVHLLGFTPFMCDARLCFPVVGGVLVHKDIGHLTTTFSTTLGPYLRRSVNRLMRSWG